MKNFKLFLIGAVAFGLTSLYSCGTTTEEENTEDQTEVPAETETETPDETTTDTETAETTEVAE